MNVRTTLALTFTSIIPSTAEPLTPNTRVVEASGKEGKDEQCTIYVVEMSDVVVLRGFLSPLYAILPDLVRVACSLSTLLSMRMPAQSVISSLSDYHSVTVLHSSSICLLSIILRGFQSIILSHFWSSVLQHSVTVLEDFTPPFCHKTGGHYSAILSQDRTALLCYSVTRPEGFTLPFCHKTGGLYSTILSQDRRALLRHSVTRPEGFTPLFCHKTGGLYSAILSQDRGALLRHSVTGLEDFTPLFCHKTGGLYSIILSQ